MEETLTPAVTREEKPYCELNSLSTLFGPGKTGPVFLLPFSRRLVSKSPVSLAAVVDTSEFLTPGTRHRLVYAI